MSEGSGGSGLVWSAVLERFERHAPAGVMARLALEHALPGGWVDDVFEAHRRRQYSRELLFSTVVELTTLVSLGLRPSLRYYVAPATTGTYHPLCPGPRIWAWT